MLAPRTLDLPAGSLPQVVLRSVRRHPFLFRKLIDRVDAHAKPGDLVELLTPQGSRLGYGLYSPRAEIAVRMLTWGDRIPDPGFWTEQLTTAVELRRDWLRLDAVTNAYRLIHAEADGLSGLVVDRLGDTLSAELFSLAMYQRAAVLLQQLSAMCGTQHTIIQIAPQTHGQEGFLADPVASPALPAEVEIHEHGTKFLVQFQGGHKTGFFCDQRDNRARLAAQCAGKSVLDLCCYTGGFAVTAKTRGQAGEVTAVDLDETAIALARRNAQLNQARLNFVHADAFGYMRDMQAHGRQFDVVVLDPPKLIRSRRDLETGTRTHLDLNRLAIPLVRPGGLFVTCTCSGLLSSEEFFKVVQTAARQAGSTRGEEFSHDRRELQLLERTGAGADHPVALDCPETEYLKALWFRVL